MGPPLPSLRSVALDLTELIQPKITDFCRSTARKARALHTAQGIMGNHGVRFLDLEIKEPDPMIPTETV